MFESLNIETTTQVDGIAAKLCEPSTEESSSTSLIVRSTSGPSATVPSILGNNNNKIY